MKTVLHGLIMAGLSSAVLPHPGSQAGEMDYASEPGGTVCLPADNRKTVRVHTFEPGWNGLAKASKALDGLRSKVEEWGLTTISAPVAVFVPNAFEVPDNFVKPEEAFRLALASRNASAFQATEVGINNQFGGVATPTIIPPPLRAMVNPAAGGTAASTTTASTTTTTSATGPQNPPLFDSRGEVRPSLNAEDLQLPAAATAASFGFGALTAPFGLVPPITLTAPLNSALQQAQEVVVRQKIYRQMSIADGIEGHSKVIFCIVQVSCNPGWRTKEHYIADCSASLEYFNMCTEKALSRAAHRQPTVFSVLPLIDAQTVEMGNSQREVTQLAFQLAASLPLRGVDVKARDLFQFVRRYSRDLKSLTPIPVVNSYSTGNSFGFRFSPSFQALRDPAQKRAKAANVLLPTSFPALVTVVLHDKDIMAAALEMKKDLVHEGLDNGGSVTRTNLPVGMSIITHTSTRWYLKDRLPARQFISRLFTPMKRDTIWGNIVAAKDVADYYRGKKWYEDHRNGWHATDEENSKRRNFDPVLEEMRRSITDLESKGLGRSWPVDISGDFFARVAAKEEKIRQDEKDVEIERLAKELATVKREAAAAAAAAEKKRLEAENELLRQILLKGGGKGGSASITAPDDGHRSALVPPPALRSSGGAELRDGAKPPTATDDSAAASEDAAGLAGLPGDPAALFPGDAMVRPREPKPAVAPPAAPAARASGSRARSASTATAKVAAAKEKSGKDNERPGFLAGLGNVFRAKK